MHRILLVDDDKDVIFLLQKKLHEKGFDVHISDDSHKALQNFKPNFYDLIILDVRMPGMGGFELFDRLKKVDPNARINFMTAFEFHPNDEKYIVSDVTGKGFIEKPVSISKLIEIINVQIQNPHTS